MNRTLTPLDACLLEIDKVLRALWTEAQSTRATPGDAETEAELSEAERRQVIALMRVNHAGEICAQALYQGQALTARAPRLRASLAEAAEEETEHLAWTQRRICELGGRVSLLNPFWYAGSLVLGALAGAAGDRWNLGFLAETERQVAKHLQTHLDHLPAQDKRSRAILEQMKSDETRHAETAIRLGAAILPAPLRGLMRLVSKCLICTAARL
ncbi:MAG: 2-polyprenyl-3-methyl-6-methoxy-1,4-benzoquinone monooxygenase [Zoogloeaceae bacterium]|jgi:ubiquinone biosynthesis monooxygenase Coq7|nr:2-polyprenyl-3-methyl-6-methoxy-1,4-benzoquinone monooxygenase [Zoogloeaceae bacterium]